MKIPIHRTVNLNNTAEAVKNIFVQQEGENSSILQNSIHLYRVVYLTAPPPKNHKLKKK